MVSPSSWSHVSSPSGCPRRGGEGGLLCVVLPKWGVLVQPLGSSSPRGPSTRRRNRTPFDLPESSELGGRYQQSTAPSSSRCQMAEGTPLWWARPSGDPLLRRVAVSVLARGVPLPGGFAVAVPPRCPALLMGPRREVVFFAFYTSGAVDDPPFRYTSIRWGEVMLPLSLLNIFVTGCSCSTDK